MAVRLFGIETEYALTGLDGSGEPINRDIILNKLMALARARLPHVPDVTGHGMFLATGARFYIDAPDHPEFTTPECTTPWEVVRYVQAGERTLLRLADELVVRGRRVAEVVILRSNVDYSGTDSTWGTHESYLHRSNPRALPAQVIPHLVSRIIYTGAGGFNSRFRHGIDFTLSPRVPHLEHAVSEQSTHSRGIFHTKDESLSSNGYHRLHILCGESLCSELAGWLKVGTTALVVALIDGGANPGDAVHLASPLTAMQTFASDPTCTATVPASSGKQSHRARHSTALPRHGRSAARHTVHAALGGRCVSALASDARPARECTRRCGNDAGLEDQAGVVQAPGAAAWDRVGVVAALELHRRATERGVGTLEASRQAATRRRDPRRAWAGGG